MKIIDKLPSVVCRAFSSSTAQQGVRTWQILKYGNTDELKLNTMKLPSIERPNDILVKVHAASINPIDVLMLGGFGSKAIGLLRQVSNFPGIAPEFPLTLGRDFSGTIVETGLAVKSLKIGDQVWGVAGPERSGTHAEYVLADSSSVTVKPSVLSHVEAASIPYTGLTAWSALCCFGGLTESSAFNKRILILGGSGGLGVIAIQLLKAWGAEVTATCNTDAVQMLQELGTDIVVDYKNPDSKQQLEQLKGFDLILDAVGGGSQNYALELLKKWRNSKYITVSAPALNYMDQYGLCLGALISSAEAVKDTLQGLQNGQSVRWAYFTPNQTALKRIKELVEEAKIKPVVEKVFPFEEIPEAYSKVLSGHARGKTVIEIAA